MLKISNIFDKLEASTILAEIIEEVQELETRHLFECAVACGKRLSCKAYWDVGGLTGRPWRIVGLHPFFNRLSRRSWCVELTIFSVVRMQKAALLP